MRLPFCDISQDILMYVSFIPYEVISSVSLQITQQYRAHLLLCRWLCACLYLRKPGKLQTIAFYTIPSTQSSFLSCYGLYVGVANTMRTCQMSIQWSRVADQGVNMSIRVSMAVQVQRVVHILYIIIMIYHTCRLYTIFVITIVSSRW